MPEHFREAEAYIAQEKLGIRLLRGAEILYTDNTAPEPGTELLIFYVINEENLQYGIRYKNSVSTADPNKYEYVGTHGAYVMTPAEPTK